MITIGMMLLRISVITTLVAWFYYIVFEEEGKHAELMKKVFFVAFCTAFALTLFLLPAVVKEAIALMEEITQ